MPRRETGLRAPDTGNPSMPLGAATELEFVSLPGALLRGLLGSSGSTAAADAVIDRKEKMGDRVSYERNIRQMFRDRDIQSMSFAFDLSSFDEVRANAEAIYEKLAAGSMPCDGPWPAEDVGRFRTWIDNGSPRSLRPSLFRSQNRRIGIRWRPS